MEALLNLNTALAGRYHVEREIGSGGMAIVYLARDVRHDRRVALKVLRPELGAVLGIERFLSEIKVTANLQHPNLLPLFDSGEANGLLFYVMPFVEGESLRDRLTRERQLPVDDAVRIGVAVASALDYAHKHGVIHRDLKPENILLQEGQPVVADFGIALAVTNAGGTRITQTGLSLGTPQYMSPEQATGDHTIDGRTDTYSLAAVLYEMLTGEPPHTGHSVQAIIARVLTDKPRPVRAMRETVPAYVEAAIHKALAKVPADRFVTPNEFAQALQGRVMLIPDAAGAVAEDTPRASRVASWAKGPIPWAAFVVAAAAAGWSWLARPDEQVAAPARFELTLPPGARLDVTSSPLPIALSPDGRHIVYVGTAGGGRQLFIRKIDELEARPLPGTSTAISPVISPDGRWIAWASFASLHKKPIDGGPTVDLVGVQDFRGLAWASDDELIVSSGAPGVIAKLWRVSASGGPLREFTRLDSAAREAIQLAPVAVRDHGLVLYSSGRVGTLATQLAVARLSDGATRVFDISADYVLGFALGHVIYMHDNGVMAAVPFDIRNLSLTGTPVALTQGLRDDIGALSPSGTLVYARGLATNEIVTVDERGVSNSLIGQPRQYAHPRLSPDGHRLAIDVTNGPNADIWTYDVATGTPTRLTT
ncbi:MAG TPA: protein kinase, partial [Gemmatimonadaceae bacterium]|nr:protein kinase [Gemmatimonadaceae bacterium]